MYELLPLQDMKTTTVQITVWKHEEMKKSWLQIQTAVRKHACTKPGKTLSLDVRRKKKIMQKL